MHGLRTISKVKFLNHWISFPLLILSIYLFTSCPKKHEKKPEVLYETTNHTMQKGETFEVALETIVNRETTLALINAMGNAGFSFRHCMPGDSICIHQRNDSLVKLSYYRSPMNVYYVVWDNNDYEISMKYPYIDTVCCLLTGDIQSTLYESVLEYDEHPKLVWRFADVFAWEIDFVTETQKGDSFFMYFEKIYCDSIFIDYVNMLVTRYKGYIGDYYGFYYVDPDNYEDYYNLEGQSLRKSLLKSPLRYSYISSYFSKRRFHPILKVYRPHHGLDYAAPTGTPVSTIGDGVVIFKGWKGGYGNLVEIRHKNNFKTRYGHLSRFAKGLYKGKRVKMGELIGYVGSTGLSTGPHLHFELHKNGVPTNPLKIKIPRAPAVKKKYLSEFKAHRDSLIKFLEPPPEPAPEEEISCNHNSWSLNIEIIREGICRYI